MNGLPRHRHCSLVLSLDALHSQVSNVTNLKGTAPPAEGGVLLIKFCQPNSHLSRVEATALDELRRPNYNP